ncbi:HlyD family secretion protein [Buttiauxella brennerae]|uniref:HlyD family secretion protein n=1 Tax=Buttiauxella brennerae TaxID=82988 RepID=UPI00286F62EF|nr:HlyD family secretion protein [Buttiauxella brennerae]
MKGNKLFRQEAIEQQKAKWAGNALLVRGYPAWVVASTCLFSIIILAAMLIFGSYTRRINIQGEIVTQPRAVTLYAPQQGVIASMHVQTGQIIKKGTPLYQLDVSRETHSGNVTATVTAAINKQIADVQSIIEKLRENQKITSATLEKQISETESGNKKAELMVKDSAAGMNAMGSSMKTYEEYLHKGLINKDQFNNQRYLYYQQQNSYQSLNSQLIQEKFKLSTLRSQLTTGAADFDNQIAQYQFQLGELQRQLTEADAGGSLIVHAPVDGVVTSLNVTSGQMVAPGDSITQLVPADINAWHLVLWLPNDSLPYVAAGDNINIRYDAFPYQKFGQFTGHILSISAVPSPVQEMATYGSTPRNPGGSSDLSWYKVTVALDRNSFEIAGREIFLTNGMRAEATLFLETRQIYQWMLSPFYDIKKSITGPVNG